MFGKRSKEKKAAAQSWAETWPAFERWAQEPTALADCLDFRQLLSQPAFKDFFEQVMASEAVGRAALDKLSGELAAMDVYKGCLSAHLCGALIEQWGANAAVGRQLVEAFCRVLALCCAFLAQAQQSLGSPEEDFDAEALSGADLAALFAQQADETRAFLGCDLITLAVMAVITRQSEARMYLREQGVYEQVQVVQRFKENMTFVDEVYRTCSQLEVTVLAPKVMRGFRAVLHDVNNCFHLFTLLEAELCRQGWLEDYAVAGYRWDKALYEVATGQRYPKSQASIGAHQQYYTVWAVQPDGGYQVTRKTEAGVQMDPNALIWGEMPPEAIPLWQGQRIIIMDSEGMFAGRSWDVSFITKCHDALSPSLRLTETLSEEACHKLWETIKHKEQ